MESIDQEKTGYSRDKAVYAIAVGLMIALSVPWFFINPMNGDTAFFAHSGKMLLNGARLYQDIVEPDAPPPYLFAELCVEFGRLVGLAPEPALVLMLSALILLVIYRTNRILARLFPDQPYAAPFLTVIITYCLLPYVKDMFGEREHILTCMILPWLLGSTSDSDIRSRREQILDGIMAAIGIAMKPYFIAVYAVVQLVNLIYTRRRAQVIRLDNVLIALVQVAVAIGTLTLYPDYLFVVRMALATYNFKQTLISLVLDQTFFQLIFVSLLSLKRVSGLRFSQIRNMLLLVGWAMAAILLYQGEAFGYHYYPLGVMAFLALGTLFLDWVRPSRLRKMALVAIAGLLAVGIKQGTENRGMPKMTGPLLPVVQREAQGKPVLVLATTLWAGSPLINYAGATSAWRFRSMWTLGGLYREKPAPDNPHPYHSRDEMNQYERFLIDSLNEDMDSNPPQLIIVETGDDIEGFRDGKFDHLDYFLQDELFAKAFSQYEQLPDVTRYKLYRRRLIGPEALPHNPRVPDLPPAHAHTRGSLENSQ